MRVAIADDSVLVREGLGRILAEHGLEVTAAVGDAERLLSAVAEDPPDVAVLDIRMPPTHTDEGLEAARAIRIRFPSVGVIVLSQYIDADYALRLLDGRETGSGYLLKDRIMDAAELVSAIERVASGQTVVDAELVSSLLDRRRSDRLLEELTEREREVLELMAEGLTDRGIAERLWVTPKTVETHVRHIIRKLDLPAGFAYNRRVHAVLAYLRS
ncbi:MAG TPA: response regulator transcription factor [Gaiella sp.]|jgi:DNA-binding NarL/FixJ family response regulator|nr:response regulator transcription factor [Gaiella sp.]